jgi:hypothetical protein
MPRTTGGPAATPAASRWCVIGIDAATESARIGLARACGRPGAGPRAGTAATLELRDAALAPRPARDAPDRSGIDATAEQVAAWVIEARAAREAVLLAIDAPLGWPAPLADGLAAHRAGEELRGTPHALFRRTTDRRIHERMGKLPLEVGADRIARTAQAALRLLAAVRQRTGLGLPLPLRLPVAGPGAAVEVYPAATRRGLPADAQGGAGLADYLAGHLKMSWQTLAALEDPDVRDAVLCVLAGADILAGTAIAPGPAERTVARREGWIWCRSAAAGGEGPPDG